MVSSNFLHNIIKADIASGIYTKRSDSEGRVLPQIITRFPPEPNGYLHIGHAKSLYVNFSLAEYYHGRCHVRFDDTNPETENQEYISDIIDSIKWLGFNWNYDNKSYLFYASNYFEIMYTAAQILIKMGCAYVDEQSIDQVRETRGTLIKSGVHSPWRDRPLKESLRLFEEMRRGQHPNGSLILRAKINMASPNLNLRDPLMYRIRHAMHFNTGKKWCIYPMYSYAHPIEDAVENISHSICTLEFEDQRPFYDWVLARLVEANFFKKPVPRQCEFARLNITHVITSKRVLKQLVDNRIVSGWDDPRMPTIIGLRRRGYTSNAIRSICEHTGVSKNNSWIDYSILENALRNDLDKKVPRVFGILYPLKLIIDNFSATQSIECTAPIYPVAHPLHSSKLRYLYFTKELWIEKEDFIVMPCEGYFRLFPGSIARLRYGYIIECTGYDQDIKGNIVAVHCNYYPDSKSGTIGSSKYKVRGNLHWVSTFNTLSAKVHLYEHLFSDLYPEAEGIDFKLALNPNSKKTITAYVEPTLKTSISMLGDTYQFERCGYFILDRIESTEEQFVFNRIVSLKDRSKFK